MEPVVVRVWVRKVLSTQKPLFIFALLFAVETTRPLPLILQLLVCVCMFNRWFLLLSSYDICLYTFEHLTNLQGTLKYYANQNILSHKDYTVQFATNGDEKETMSCSSVGNAGQRERRNYIHRPFKVLSVHNMRVCEPGT